MNKNINDIPEHDRPREKLLRKGAAALSDQELLAVLLGKGTPGMDVMTLAGKLARVSPGSRRLPTARRLPPLDLPLS